MECRANANVAKAQEKSVWPRLKKLKQIKQPQQIHAPPRAPWRCRCCQGFLSSTLSMLSEFFVGSRKVDQKSAHLCSLSALSSDFCDSSFRAPAAQKSASGFAPSHFSTGVASALALEALVHFSTLVAFALVPEALASQTPGGTSGSCQFPGGACCCCHFPGGASKI